MTKTREGASAPALTPQQEAHREELRARELAIAELHQAKGQDAQLEAIAADRASRWAKLLKGRTELPQILDWANQMTALYGPRVMVWRNRLPWITALYVVRYGEAEHFWPAQLTAGDLERAHGWAMRGDTPGAVRYILAEEG